MTTTYVVPPVTSPLAPELQTAAVPPAPPPPAPPPPAPPPPAPPPAAPQSITINVPRSDTVEHREGPTEVRLYSHSTFFYWWPVWAVGYLMALITWMGGHTEAIGGAHVLIHPSKNLGVLFTLTVFLVILITNVTMRGTASVVVLLGAAFLALLLAYFELWADLLASAGLVALYMNMGFYVVFSTLVFGLWALSVFVYDRLSYWKVLAGQITHETVVGGAQRSYDTRGMVFEKQRADLFRHLVLGLGSGDLVISTTGAKPETVAVPNVLFLSSKVRQIQHLIAMKPTGSA
jgi:hypothetical protein